jgi:hypothetical protein
VGFQEQALHDAVAVCGLFNMMNRLVDVLRARGLPRHPRSRRRKADWEAVAMLVRRNGLGPRQNGPLVRWPQWVQAWWEDHDQHAAARAETRAHAPLRPGEHLLAVACSVDGELLAATDWALYHHTGQPGRGWGGNS